MDTALFNYRLCRLWHLWPEKNNNSVQGRKNRLGHNFFAILFSCTCLCIIIRQLILGEYSKPHLHLKWPNEFFCKKKSFMVLTIYINVIVRIHAWINIICAIFLVHTFAIKWCFSLGENKSFSTFVCLCRHSSISSN